VSILPEILEPSRVQFRIAGGVGDVAMAEVALAGPGRRSRRRSATYFYLANSPLVSQIGFTNNGAWRMTTTKSYDDLNRLTSIASVSAASPAVSFSYSYNPANQRTMRREADGSYWRYEYDRLGQVTSGKKYWPDQVPVAGQQFEYAFDDIGNRVGTKAGGDDSGTGLRPASYTANALNQYTSREVPGAVDVMGIAFATNTVTVNGQGVYRKGEYFRKELSVNNAAAPVWTNITVNATGQASVSGNALLPKAQEQFWYDADGNLTSDSLWTNVWNGENRLVLTESGTGVPPVARLRVAWTYLPDGRWIERIVSTNNGSSYYPAWTNRYVWDGQVLLAILDHTSGLVMSFVRGLDLSGSIHGAGGVGGVLAVTFKTNGTHFVCYDGNENVTALTDASSGANSAVFEYSPFGEPLRVTGPAAVAMPLRFSTMYEDEVTGDRKYLFREYRPSLGRWLSRDPMEEEGGYNLYAFVGNAPLDYIDPFGERALSFEINGPQTPLGFSFFLRGSVTQTTCPLEVEASVFGALEWQPPGLRYLKKPFGWFNIHAEFGARGGIQGKVKYSECFGLSETKVCGRFELFGRAEYRRPGFRGPDGRFTRLRFGAGADGGVELCLNFCNGEVTAEGTFSWYGYLHFGWRDFNRTYNFGDGYSGSWSLGTFPQAALLKDYCNKAPDPNNCCCIKKYGGATSAR
jgi:RHS repeat-associated protein